MKRDSKGKRITKITKPNSGVKRSSDPNLLAHQLIREMAEKLEGPKVTEDEVSRVMAALGRKGGKIGGRKRAESLNPGEATRDSPKSCARPVGQNLGRLF
jgi:hypothetical protein